MSRGSMNPGFDQRIADWLEDDPDDAPDIVLSTVLAAFPSIPQRPATRVPWRFQTMSLSARLVAAAIALAVVAVGGAIVLRPGAQSSVGASVSPSSSNRVPLGSAADLGPLDQTFRSSRFGFSVDHPTGWTITPATSAPATIDQWADGPGASWDTLTGDRVRFLGVSAPLSAGVDGEQWIAAHLPTQCASKPSVAIGDQVGVLAADGCSTLGPYHLWSRALLATDGRMYLFQLDADESPTAKLIALLRTVQFDSPPTGSIGTSDAGRTLAAGTYRVDGFAVPVSLRLAGGWVTNGFTPHDLVLHNDATNAFLALVVMDGVYADPCHPSATPAPVPTGVDGLVSALASMKGFTVTDRKPATVGGAPGSTFILGNTIDLARDRCARTDIVWIGRDGDGAPVLETPGGAEPLWVVDASGTTVLIGGPAEAVAGITFGASAP